MSSVWEVRWRVLGERLEGMLARAERAGGDEELFRLVLLALALLDRHRVDNKGKVSVLPVVPGVVATAAAMHDTSCRELLLGAAEETGEKPPVGPHETIRDFVQSDRLGTAEERVDEHVGRAGP